mmetsp:Transcript_6868/g.9503  ORF Transcript_6868/g.9503 Transcript_6868/m.9503 type:complete len:247 (-) Transcript_6868:83-823(-)|eukprot:CAMPEP_0184480970 /NCGR_PEP_ID=MMETSP0113_2-20130426/2514_1 /TAXON_ID=91329 /ORGANISM="Norrisiella sphaerica, Strain BC52" /LENGTH=246 /DNA_ID=CAMNT_0026859817 /DNA_START=179 /DNA_END=919 /DNA_ORIENTATION=+
MSQSSFERTVEDFFYYFDQNGDGLVTIAEAKEVMKVALLGVQQDEVDAKTLEADVDRQVKHLLSKADFDHDKKISLKEFQLYYSNMVKNGMEPEVLLLDIEKATQALKAHNIPKSPAQNKHKEPKLEENSALCIIRLKKTGGAPGLVAGRLKMTTTFSLDNPANLIITGNLKGMPFSSTFKLTCEFKESKANIGEIYSDQNGASKVNLKYELPKGTTMKNFLGGRMELLDAKDKLAGTTQVIELHR